MNDPVKRTTIIFLVVFVIVSIFPQIFRSYFIQSTGSIKIIGGMLGSVIAILIYYKWKFAKYIFYFVVGSAIIFDLTVMMQDKMLIGSNFIILFILHISLLLYFIFSKNIKKYLSA